MYAEDLVEAEEEAVDERGGGVEAGWWEERKGYGSGY